MELQKIHQLPAKRVKTIRPAALPPIETSKKTTGFTIFDLGLGLDDDFSC